MIGLYPNRRRYFFCVLLRLVNGIACGFGDLSRDENRAEPQNQQRIGRGQG
jgi:hypothetical protein